MTAGEIIAVLQTVPQDTEIRVAIACGYPADGKPLPRIEESFIGSEPLRLVV